MNATRVCPGCDCALEVPIEGGDVVCGTCGNVLFVEAPPEPEVPGLATAVGYPFSSSGSILFLGITAPLYAVCRAFPFFPFNLAGQIILGGYIAQWLWEILSTTAQGRHVAPGAPLSGHLHDLAGNFFRFFGALAVAFAPSALFSGLLWWNDIPPTGPLAVITGLLTLAGLLYYPMTLLLIGFSERWAAAFHVGFALRSAWLIRRDYLTCCVFFLLTFGISTAAELGVAALPPEAGFLGAFFARLAAVIVEVLLYAVQMRAIGLVYLSNRARLGWFR